MSTVKQSKHELLTETPIPKLVWKLAVPTIISMLVTGIYNTADTYFVGQISTEATAAVGLVFTVMAIIQSLGFFCGHGSGNAVTGFTLALIIGTVLAILGILFSDTLADFIGATENSRQHTVEYMQVILLGAPFMVGQFVINNQLRFQGSAMIAMAGLMVGAVINVGLDPLLIFVFHMGVRGAAVATVCGQITSFITLLIGFSRGGEIRYHMKNIHLNLHNLLEIANGGMPSLFRQGLAALSALLLNRFANLYGGDPAIAGMSIVTRILMLNVSVLIGFGQGYQPICSYNYGGGRYQRVREGFFYCLRWGTVMMTVAGALCFLGAPEIVSWFRDDPKVITIGIQALRWQSAVLPLMATGVLTNMMLQSCGKGVIASITSSARNGIFFIPLILILPRLFGLTGVEMTQAWADVFTFLLCVPVAWRELQKMNQHSLDRDCERYSK